MQDICVLYSWRKYYCYQENALFLVPFKNGNIANIGLFSITPHLVIALPTLQQQTLSLLISLLHFFYKFCRLVNGFFSVLLPYICSYRTSNNCNSNNCRSFTLLKAIVQSNGNFFAIALKSEKEQQLSLSRQLAEQ